MDKNKKWLSLKKISTSTALLILILIVLPQISLSIINFYNPASSITQGWSQGTGTSHLEIIDTARESTAPSLATFVASRVNDGTISEFRFASIQEEYVENITLWVYTSTGSNAQYTFSLRQGTTTICSNLVSPSTTNSWRSCTWTSPTGDLTDLRIHLSTVAKNGGGGPTNAIVYSAYLAVDTGPLPPIITLIEPENESTKINLPTSFIFKAIDNHYSTIDTCSIYTNFTSTWGITDTIYDVNNDTQTTINLTQQDGYYKWSVLCVNAFGRSSFSNNNYTVYLNMEPPNISQESLNETTIRQNKSIKFNASITDYFGIDYAEFTISYPDETQSTYELNRINDEFYYDFTNTIMEGTYTIISVWANDTKGKSLQKNIDLSFEVEAIKPSSFNLTYPVNNTETRNNSPLLEWEITSTESFDNYTIQISKFNNFNVIEIEDYVHNINIITYQVSNLELNQEYYWRVIAYDAFGNYRESPVFRYVTDNTAPLINLLSPDNNAYTNKTMNYFIFNPSDSNTITGCYLYGNFTGIWSNFNYTNNIIKNNENELSTNLSVDWEGYNSWNIMCIDEAGNQGFHNENYTLIMDLSGPIVNLINPVNESVINYTNIINFEINVSDELAEIESCSLIINESVVETKYAIINNGINSFQRFLVNDNYSWSATCTDTNGWSTQAETWFFSIESGDEDDPIITLNYPSQNDYVNESSINFSFYVEDASDINNCSIFINNNLYDTVFDVVTFENYYYQVNNFLEQKHNWSVQCYDSQDNLGFSQINNFTVDLTNPLVVLHDPLNDSWSNQGSINFKYFVNDTNLNYCVLYTNETGVFENRQIQYPINNDNNTIIRTLENGFYEWNVKCHDLSGRTSFATNNFKLNVDINAPKYYNENVTPANNSIYSPSTIYNFSIDWIDENYVNEVFFEHNFSGTKINETPNNFSNTYWFSANLDAGNYNYKWHAIDTTNNKNNTNSKSYTILKDEAIIHLYLDENENNLTISENTEVNISGEISKPENGLLSLYLNNNLLTQGINIVNKTELFSYPGSYNISLVYNETTNYFGANKNLTVTVLDTINPTITLLNPDNLAQTSTGITILNYLVEDYSPISYCALYINNTLEENNTNVTKGITQSFLFEAIEETYSWRIDCADSYNNVGISETWIFTAVDVKVMNATLLTDNNEYEVGRNITGNITVKDFFNNPLISNIYAGIIKGETNKPWWDTSWKKRRNIELTETTNNDIINGIAEINITNLTINNCEEIRIINQENAKAEEVLFLINNSGSNWCKVLFEVNISSSTTNNDYYVYYNNSGALVSEQYLSRINNELFNAMNSQADEPTVNNPLNIIGKDDESFASMTVSGGGGGSAAAHGLTFISDSPKGTITKVEARYRYEVPTFNNLNNWALRYSTNNGGTYNVAFTGTTGVGKITSPWHDITSSYATLAWNNVNTTRLQGRITKNGGGGNVALNLFWVELNVTYEKDILVTNTMIFEEEILVENFSGITQFNGVYNFEWSTKNEEPGNYTVFGWAKKDEFDNAKDTKLITILPDITNPSINLTNPLNDSKINKGLINLSFEVHDTNIDSCTLFIGQEELLRNKTIQAINGTNFISLNLTYNYYNWNIECNDTYNNSAFSNNNYTFTVIVPNPVLETDLYENDSFIISWDEIEDAQEYNIYLTNNYETGFSETPNITTTETSYYFNTSNIDKQFFKITAINNSRESEIGGLAGIYSQNLEDGFNMISLPFYIKEYKLYDGINGLKFITNNTCLIAIWKYNSSTKEFKSADWINGEFVPSTGSEDFTHLNEDEGYFLETNNSCKLKIGGIIPISNKTINLFEGQNLVSWLSVKEEDLSANNNPAILSTQPEHSIRAINRLNNTNQTYELISQIKVGDEYYWQPSVNNIHFTFLKPMESYYFDSLNYAEWIHEP